MTMFKQNNNKPNKNTTHILTANGVVVLKV